MNGATAEPWASTISTPNTAMMTTIGHSQYFLRVRRNAHSSLINDIAVSRAQNWLVIESGGGPGGLRTIQYESAPGSSLRRNGSLPVRRITTATGVSTP